MIGRFDQTEKKTTKKTLNEQSLLLPQAWQFPVHTSQWRYMISKSNWITKEMSCSLFTSHLRAFECVHINKHDCLCDLQVLGLDIKWKLKCRQSSFRNWREEMIGDEAFLISLTSRTNCGGLLGFDVVVVFGSSAFFEEFVLTDGNLWSCDHTIGGLGARRTTWAVQAWHLVGVFQAYFTNKIENLKHEELLDIEIQEEGLVQRKTDIQFFKLWRLVLSLSFATIAACFHYWEHKTLLGGFNIQVKPQQHRHPPMSRCHGTL